MKIKGTKNTPEIIFEQASLKISGRSTLTDAKTFYKDVLAAVDEWKKSPKIKVVFDLEHFNTPSAKAVLDIMKKLEDEDAKIVWVFGEDDEDMEDAGSDYESMVKLPFEFKEKLDKAKTYGKK